MGAGLAADCRQRYPDPSIEYMNAAKRKKVSFDRPLLVESDGIRKYEKKFLFVATKDHFRNPSRAEWVFRSIAAISSKISLHNPPSIAIPALGCGLGGLSYTKVHAWLLDLASFHPATEFELYPPQ